MGGIKATFLEEELETQQWEQAGLDGIGRKVGFREQRSGTTPVPHSSPPPRLHPVLPLPQVTDFVVELLTYKFLARQYDLEPKEHFLSFFRRVKLLREDQR